MGKRCAFLQMVLEQLDRHMQKTNRKNSLNSIEFPSPLEKEGDPTLNTMR